MDAQLIANIVVLVALVALVAGTPDPAEAHTVAGVQPTNYRSEIVAVTPSVAGLPKASTDPASVTGRGANPAITSGRSV